MQLLGSDLPVFIPKSDIVKLSADIRHIVDGKDLDLRDNSEGAFSVLKNDINTLANLKSEQIVALKRERDILRKNLEDISHQLKTPLTSTIIMADLLEGAPPEKQTEFIDSIKHSLTRMEWLVSTLLKLAKLDAGVINFYPEKVASSELTSLALEPLLVMLDEKQQRVELVGELAGEAKILCDKRWTTEALSNILKNASEYSPQGGTIVVEAGENPICSWLAVTDSGTGISTSDIATLFRRFEGSRSEHGYGIGLPLALAIMRGQNGDIQVDAGNAAGSAAKTSPTRDGTPKGAIGATFTCKFFK